MITNSHLLTIKFDGELMERIEELAKANERRVGAQIRYMLKRYLEQVDGAPAAAK